MNLYRRIQDANTIFPYLLHTLLGLPQSVQIAELSRHNVLHFFVD